MPDYKGVADQRKQSMDCIIKGCDAKLDLGKPRQSDKYQQYRLHLLDHDNFELRLYGFQKALLLEDVKLHYKDYDELLQSRVLYSAIFDAETEKEIEYFLAPSG